MSETNQPSYDAPFSAETDLVKQTISVKLQNGAEFEFKIPSIVDEVKLGQAMRRLRQQLDPQDDLVGNLDPDTMGYLRALAWFEVLLRRSSVTWTHTAGENGRMVVDSMKFPPEETDNILMAAALANTEVSRFRQARTTARRPVGEQAVVSS